jgi:arginyl-tRNA synthetase
MNIQQELSNITAHIISTTFDLVIKPEDIIINQNPREYPGDYTIVLFSIIKKTGQSPQQLADLIVIGLKSKFNFVSGYNLVKGFLNIEFNPNFWNQELSTIQHDMNWGFQSYQSGNSSVIIEYPSPNTNKPLHLGHLRNIFLGFSIFFSDQYFILSSDAKDFLKHISHSLLLHNLLLQQYEHHWFLKTIFCIEIYIS